MDINEPSGYFFEPPMPTTDPHHDRRGPTDPHAEAGSVSGVVAVTEAELYTPAEAAAILKMRESWLRYKVKKDQIPYTRPGNGRETRFSRLDLIRIVRMGQQQPSQADRAPVQPPTPRPKRGRTV